MGAARRTSCNSTDTIEVAGGSVGGSNGIQAPHMTVRAEVRWKELRTAGYIHPRDPGPVEAAQAMLPLVYQKPGGAYPGNSTTTVLAQPLDLTVLAPQYKNYVEGFIASHAQEPFFLYMPFSHVHATAPNQPQEQYAGCAFRNTSRRGMFGDALAEVDWIVGAVVAAIKKAGVENNTITIFTGRITPSLYSGIFTIGTFAVAYSRYHPWHTDVLHCAHLVRPLQATMVPTWRRARVLGRQGSSPGCSQDTGTLARGRRGR
jgi:hypothetical protein